MGNRREYFGKWDHLDDGFTTIGSHVALLSGRRAGKTLEWRALERTLLAVSELPQPVRANGPDRCVEVQRQSIPDRPDPELNKPAGR